MKAYYSIIIVILFLLDSPMQYADSIQSKSTQQNAPIMLLVHGLNNNTAIFDALTEEFIKSNIKLRTLKLSGHARAINDQHAATSQKWLEEVKSEIKLIHADNPATPIYAFGYSLGGLLLVHALQDPFVPKIEKLILLAPALKVRLYTKFVKAAFPFSFVDFSLPSMAPTKYLAYPYTSIRSYQALFLLISQFEQMKNWQENLPDTLVISHKHDPLIAHADLVKLFKGEQPRFEVYERLDDLNNYSYTFHHLFAKEAFSSEEWLRQINVINNFLIED